MVTREVVKREEGIAVRPPAAPPRITPETIQETIQSIALLQGMVKDLLIRGVDYGRIPGTPQDSLWDPGASQIISSFNCYPGQRRILKLEDSDQKIVAVVEVPIISRATGQEVGTGIGAASTLETKYKYRWVPTATRCRTLLLWPVSSSATSVDKPWKSTPSPMTRPPALSATAQSTQSGSTALIAGPVEVESEGRRGQGAPAHPILQKEKQMKTPFIVIKTTTTIVTEVFHVEVEARGTYPTSEDLAITAAGKEAPIASETRRDATYKTMIERG